jgi:hypothetical protein
VFFHRQSRTVLFTDLIQHFGPAWFTGWRAVVAKLDLMVAPEPQVPRKFRTAFVNRRAARAALTRILAWPAKRVLMAHCRPDRRWRPGVHRARIPLAVGLNAPCRHC